MGDFCLVVNAARRTVGNKDINLGVVGKNLPAFLLGVHDCGWIGLIANAALEAGKRFTLVLPSSGVHIHDANFVHIVATAVVSVNADFWNMFDLF